MARNAVVSLLVVAAILFLIPRPLVALVLIGAAGAIFLDGRHRFGYGRHRAVIAFISALWIELAGVITTILGMVPPGDDRAGAARAGNFLLLPGFLLLGMGITLLAWAMVTMLRMRRAGH